MKLELDKRIDSLSDVFNFSNIQYANEFIGENGYFTNTIYFLKNIQSCKYGTLENIFTGSTAYNVFRRKEDGCYYEFFIPETFLKSKEKKYRPYTLPEFFDRFTIGQPIKFRMKGIVEWEKYLILNGYRHERHSDQTITNIYIGSCPYTFDQLLNEYEWQDPDTGEWDLFGVEN